MQSMRFLCYAMLFHRLTVAIRFLAVAPLVSAIPLRDPSALCRRAALLRLCFSLLGFAYAFLTVTSPPRLSAMLFPCNPALCHAVCEAKHTKLCLRRSPHRRSMQYHCFSWLTMQYHCAAARSYTLATPLRAFPWRISSVQSKTSAKQYLAPAQPYLAVA